MGFLAKQPPLCDPQMGFLVHTVSRAVLLNACYTVGAFQSPGYRQVSMKIINKQDCKQ